MDKHDGPRPPVPEDDLHPLVDGRLAPEPAQSLRQRIAFDAAAKETVQSWQAQRETLRCQFLDVADREVPQALVAAAERAERTQARAYQLWRWGGMAASLLLAFGLGWSGSSQWRAFDGQLARAEPAHRFARQAAVAHAVYQPEVRHPVEVAAAQHEHLVQWLSKRLGRDLKVPVLADQGFELVGGRLLPGDEGARAQFMYQDTKGQRITLYLGAIKPGSGETARETAFRFLDDGPVPGFYWVDQGFGYAIAGQLPRPVLQALATSIYRQL